ncbi:MAG: hypothetical protein MUE81_09315 [Thermoflexibacter sp.]|jgi:hypothetical protein|nr:hypothetical protein [Thermoflexibacter sp.]
MLTEKELLILSAPTAMKTSIATLKANFSELEEVFTKIDELDFTALILLTPAISLALSNREITFFEELMLNRKARQLSQESYFLKRDPIVHAMQYLVIHFEEWEDRFYQVISDMIDDILEKHHTNKRNLASQEHLDNEELILATPPLFIKLLAFLFLDKEEDFFMPRKVSAFEYKKILEISKKLSIRELSIFKRFYETFAVL